MRALRAGVGLCEWPHQGQGQAWAGPVGEARFKLGWIWKQEQEVQRRPFHRQTEVLMVRGRGRPKQLESRELCEGREGHARDPHSPRAVGSHWRV